MDLIKSFLDREGDSIVSELTGRGFSAEQAGRFLPEAVTTLLQNLKSADIADLLGSGGGFSGLLGSVDISSLASRTGVDNATAETGLNALIPRLMEFVKDKQGLSNLLGDKAGSLTSVFKGLLH